MATTPRISVVICTRNPRPAVLGRVLRHLDAQTLPMGDREVVIIDNGSRPSVRELLAADAAEVRVVEHAEIGLTSARLRGIRETAGDLIVFVDDDNLLDPAFLATAIRITDSFPRIGVFGGRISPEFETAPPEWLEPFRSHLALAHFDRDEWSNVGDDRAVIPCGAGLCVRREAAVAYAEAVAVDRRRHELDRRGDRTLSCGDTDLVLTCLDRGWGSGRFTSLHLTHVIPAARLDYAYQRQLAADIGWSYGRLLALRGQATRGRRWIAFLKTVLAFLGVRHRGKTRGLDLAYHHGFWRGLAAR